MDEESKLGIDATQAFAALRKLQQSFSKYSKSVDSAANASESYNASASKSEDILSTLSRVSGAAARAFLQLVRAKREAIKASKDLQNQEKKEAENRKTAIDLERKRVATSTSKTLLNNIVPGNRAKATLPEVVAFDKSLDTFKNVVKQSKLTEGEVNKVLANLGGAYSGAARKVRDAAAQVVGANARLGKTNLAAVARLLKQAGIEANKANPALKGFQLNLSSIANFTIASLISQSIQNLGAAFVQGAKDARDFEFRLAEILTISDRAFGSLDEVGSIVTRLSGEFGQPGPDVAAGLYEILSNNIKGASESVFVLTEALKFGRASLTSTADSVGVLTGVLNSYGISAASTSRISDILFKTIDLGRVTGAELANTIGRILPLAATLGVRFEEVAASLATLTIQGVNAADAETQITNIFLKLIRPTEALQRRYEELGIATAEAGIAAFGFQGFLQEITKDSGTAASDIGELFNQIRGTRGVLGQVSTGAQLYAQNLRRIQEESRGAAAAAASLIQETNAGVLTAELEKVRNFLVNDFGRSVLAALAGLVRIGIDGKVAIAALTTAFATMVGGGTLLFLSAVPASILAIKAAALSTIPAVAAFGSTLSTVAIAAIPVAFAAATLAYLQFRDANAEARKELDAFSQATEKAAAAEIAAAREPLEERKRATQEKISAISREIIQLNKLYNKDRQNALKTQEGITDSFKRQLSERQSLINQFIDRVGDIQNQSANNVRDLNEDFADFEFGINQGRFDRSIEGLDPRRQGAAIQQRINQIVAQARQAARDGNASLTKELFGEAANLGNQLAGITGQRAQGERAINQILSERRAVNQELINQENAKAKAAQKVAEQQRQLADRVIRDIDLFNQGQAGLQSALQTGGDPQAIAQLREELNRLGKDIETNLGKFSLGELSGFKDLAELKNITKQISAPIISPTSLQPVPLTFAVDEGIRDVLTKLTETTRRTPPELFVKVRSITGTDLDIFDPSKAEKDFAQVGQLVERGMENSLAKITFNKSLQDASGKIETFRKGLAKNAKDAFEDANIDITGGLFSNNNAEIAAQQFSNNVSQLLTRAIRGIEEGVQTDALPRLREILSGLNTQAQSPADLAAGGSAGKAAASLQQIISGLEGLAEARANLARADERGAAVSLLEQAIGGSATKVSEVRAAIDFLKTDSGTAIQTVQNSFDSFSTQNARNQVDQLISKINSIPSAPAGVALPTAAARQALGGFPRFGLGGIGVDNQLALLNRREFVMNAEMSRRFKPELLAMNAGRRPNFATGGPVSNNTFGDININVGNQKVSEIDARKLARSLQREMRRRTSRI